MNYWTPLCNIPSCAPMCVHVLIGATIYILKTLNELFVDL